MEKEKENKNVFQKLELIGIYKQFLSGKIVANNKISLTFFPGEIHSLVGENGSGKSTLMSILFGLYQQDAGTIKINDQEVDMYNQGAAKRYKIGMVHQHFHLIDKFSVFENVILGQDKLFFKNKWFKILDKRKALQHFDDICKKYGIDLEPNRLVRTLNIGDRQKVEILKVLWEPKNLIVFDEPTATLSVNEIKLFLQIIKKLKSDNVSVIFISHKLKEVKLVSDKISILHRGKMLGTYPNKTTFTIKKIAALMIGKDISLKFTLPKPTNEVMLRVENLRYFTSRGFEALRGVSFEIRKGEIFGLAGLEGNGQEEIVDIISGLKKATKESKAYFNDKSILDLKISKRMEFISHIPIERFQHGIISTQSILFNSSITSFTDPQFSSLKFKNKTVIVDLKNIKKHTQMIIETTNVEGANDVLAPIRDLSGGNQQKFLVSRELLRPHQLMIAGHPTRGLDIKAISNIYQNLVKNSENKATLLYSLEISELIKVCHRIAILYKGKIVKIIEPKKYSLLQISHFMVGEGLEDVKN